MADKKKSPFYTVMTEDSGAKTLYRKGSAYDNQIKYSRALTKGMLTKGVSDKIGRTVAGKMVAKHIKAEAKDGFRWNPRD